MLVTMKEIVDAADAGGYCVPAPNYADTSQLHACIAAAEESKSPLILDIGRFDPRPESRPAFIELCTASRAAAEAASVPVCINLDHGSLYEIITQCIYDGCTSVMVDRSAKEFEDNVAEVSEIVKIAHAVGVSVEAELGHVGSNESDKNDPNAFQKRVDTEEEKRAMYTNPDQAVEYVERTGVDCLAVAVGTVHGFYPEGFEPSVDFDLLKEIHEKVNVPLVIHGGSGSGDEILAGMAPYASKLNVGHDLAKAYNDALAEACANPSSEPMWSPIGAAEEAFKNELIHYQTVLGSVGKA